jgi:hypothetical protein
MKTSELAGKALNWAVGKAEGLDGWLAPVNYSGKWEHGGPIIEREKITLEWTGEDWMAYIKHDDEFFGVTPLFAAMRCYVASKLGDEVEVPDEMV